MRDDHAGLTRAGIPTHDAEGKPLKRDERLLIWTARKYGEDFVWLIFELAEEVAAGRMTTEKAFEALLFDYGAPDRVAPSRDQ